MAEATKKENIFKRFTRWLREMRSELKKIVWPTKKQMINNLIIVLAVCVCVGVCIWVMDAVSSLFVQGIISLVKG